MLGDTGVFAWIVPCSGFEIAQAADEGHADGAECRDGKGHCLGGGSMHVYMCIVRQTRVVGCRFAHIASGKVQVMKMNKDLKQAVSDLKKARKEQSSGSGSQR